MKTNTPVIYTTGNAWQKKVYQKMSDYLSGLSEVKSYGASVKGTQYKHLLPMGQAHLNFMSRDIYLATLDRFTNHKAGDLNRVLTNTAASQAYCFNLVLFLQKHIPLANKLFSNLIGKTIEIVHLEPEFTPNHCSVSQFDSCMDESIGDQSKRGGTDADIALFYIYDKDKKGVLLIEFKFIESEFSVCSSYADKENIRKTCDSGSFYNELMSVNKPGNHSCGYTRYKNWQLTTQSQVIDFNKIKSVACPFRFGLNQLWRNFLLAEQVSGARGCNEYGFWVFSPKENDDYLWKKGETERQLRNILTERGNQNFKKVWLESVFDILRSIVSTPMEKEWLTGMEKKYRI